MVKQKQTIICSNPDRHLKPLSDKLIEKENITYIQYYGKKYEIVVENDNHVYFYFELTYPSPKTIPILIGYMKTDSIILIPTIEHLVSVEKEAIAFYNKNIIPWNENDYAYECDLKKNIRTL